MSLQAVVWLKLKLHSPSLLKSGVLQPQAEPARNLDVSPIRVTRVQTRFDDLGETSAQERQMTPTAQSVPRAATISPLIW